MKLLLLIAAGVALVLGLFYLAKAGIVENAAVARISDSVSSDGTSIPNNNEASIEYAARTFVSYATSIAKKFVETVSDMVAGKTVTETIINGSVLAAIFVILGYLAILFAKFIRFLFYAAAVFTVGVTILHILGMV